MTKYLWLVEVSDERKTWYDNGYDPFRSRERARKYKEEIVAEGWWAYARIVKFVRAA